MDQEELEEEVALVRDSMEEDGGPARPNNLLKRTVLQTGVLSSEDIKCLREKHSFLCDFSDNFIRNTSIGDLMKIQSTALKARELE